MTDKPTRIFLGVVDTSDAPSIVLTVPLDASPNAIKAALTEAEAEKARLKLAESAKLRAMFLKDAPPHD
jgi:hypothetical protein